MPLEEPERVKIEREISKVCEAAYAFALMVRRSKSMFTIKVSMQGEHVYGDRGPWYTTEAFEGIDPGQGYTGKLEVCYTMFGALSKIDHIHKKEVCLQQALLVCCKL